jgi:hypothetical protein
MSDAKPLSERMRQAWYDYVHTYDVCLSKAERDEAVFILGSAAKGLLLEAIEAVESNGELSRDKERFLKGWRDAEEAVKAEKARADGLQATVDHFANELSLLRLGGEDQVAALESSLDDANRSLEAEKSRADEATRPFSDQEWRQIQALANGFGYESDDPDEELQRGLDDWNKSKNGRLILRVLMRHHDDEKARADEAERKLSVRRFDELDDEMRAHIEDRPVRRELRQAMAELKSRDETVRVLREALEDISVVGRHDSRTASIIANRALLAFVQAEEKRP